MNLHGNLLNVVQEEIILLPMPTDIDIKTNSINKCFTVYCTGCPHSTDALCDRQRSSQTALMRSLIAFEIRRFITFNLYPIHLRV